jgi:hypothetical protein
MLAGIKRNIGSVVASFFITPGLAQAASLTLNWVSTGTLASSGIIVLPNDSLLSTSSYRLSGDLSRALAPFPPMFPSSSIPDVSLTFQVPRGGHLAGHTYTGELFNTTINTGAFGWSCTLNSQFNGDSCNTRFDRNFAPYFDFDGTTVTGGSSVVFEGRYNIVFNGTGPSDGVTLFGYNYEHLLFDAMLHWKSELAFNRYSRRLFRTKHA